VILTREKQEPVFRAHPSATLSTTNPSLVALGANLGLHGENPFPIRENYGMTQIAVTFCQMYTASP
jgi:hypothetical protein